MSYNDNFDAEWASPAEHARLYRSLGLQVLPSYMPGQTKEWKRPVVPWKLYTEALMSDDEFDKLYGQSGTYAAHKNMCLITGINNLFVVDLDTYKGPEAQLWLDQLRDQQETAADFETPTQRTGGGGLQIFFIAPKGWHPPTLTCPVQNIDIRGKGGLVIVSPSLHESGKNYDWIEGLEPWNISFAVCPRYICEAIDDLAKRCEKINSYTNIKNKTKAVEYVTEPFGNIIDGREKKMVAIIWYDLVNLYRESPIMQEGSLLDKYMEKSFKSYCMQVKSRIIEPGTPQDILLEREGRGISLFKKKWIAAYTKWETEIKEAAMSSSPYEGIRDDADNNDQTNSKYTSDNNSRKEPPKSKPKNEKDHLTIARNAQEECGWDNIISTPSGVWIWQTEGVWRKEHDQAIKQILQRTIEKLGEKVTSSLVNGSAEVFKTEIFKSQHNFNLGNPETINCLNGEVELVNGKWTLTKHRKEHYRTTQIPVLFDPTATAPKFKIFLNDVFINDPDQEEKIKSVLEMMGYSLMSHARHEKFVILIGAGANGKSVLLGILHALCGSDNVAGVQPSNFGRPFQRAHLEAMLVNIVTEIAQGEVIADAELKGITSGEPTTVEHKYGAPFVMTPYSTCWFGSNHMPRTKDFSDALFRRAVIIPFNRIFQKTEQNPNLKEELKAELPGILNLALNAYAAALINGFTEPQSCITAKQEWRLEVDQVAQFVSEKCEYAPKEETTFKDLFGAYTSWAVEEGVRMHMGKKGFSERLSRLGYGKRQTSSTRYITGIKLVANEDDFG